MGYDIVRNKMNIIKKTRFIREIAYTLDSIGKRECIVL